MRPHPETGFPGAAYVAEEVARWRAQRALGDPEADVDDATLAKHWPVTAEQLAAELQEAWKHLEATWGQWLGGTGPTSPA